MKKLLLVSLLLLNAGTASAYEHFEWTEEGEQNLREVEEQEYREKMLELQKQIEENTDRTGFCFDMGNGTAYCP